LAEIIKNREQSIKRNFKANLTQQICCVKFAFIIFAI